MQKRQALYLTLFIFLISILIRLPNLNRPVSKHHEFITAVILMNVESWRQAGGADIFHYTPLMSYQNPGDRHADTGVHIDKKGNQLYLSLPPGWYIIPYFFYQVFHLPVQPIYLRILNLLFNLITIILCFYFFEQLIPAGTEGRYFRILTGCSLFQFSPGILWYLGNGYVHTAIMLPFIMATLMILLPMLQSAQKVTALRLLFLAASVILLVYLDWFAVFLCLFITIWALFRSGKDKKYLPLVFVPGAALLVGIALIFWQFASYAGANTVALYWKLRFFDRGIPDTGSSFWTMLPYLFGHLITCYLPLLILLAGSLVWHRRKNTRIPLSVKENLFIQIYGCSIVLYAIVLIGWASGHEFSMVPAGILLAWLGARSLTIPRSGKTAYFLILPFLMLSIGQYYYINRPGAISRDGMAFNTYEVFGEHLRQVPPDYKIFSNIPENCPMIEYYAGRNITTRPDMESAKRFMREWNILKGVWVESDCFRFRKMEVIYP